MFIHWYKQKLKKEYSILQVFQLNIHNMSHLTRQMQGRPHTWAAQSSGTGGYLAYMYIVQWYIHTSQNNYILFLLTVADPNIPISQC